MKPCGLISWTKKLSKIYFFDLITFNGGTLGVWVSHVKKFREVYSTKLATINSVSNWLLSCNEFVSSTNSQYKKLYTLKDTTKSANYWKELAVNNQNEISENQVNLLVLGLIRAQLSNGNDAPCAFYAHTAEISVKIGNSVKQV